MKRCFLLFAISLSAVAAPAQSAGQLNFLGDLNDFKDLRRMLPDWLNARAAAHLAGRKAEIATITDLNSLRARQRSVRERIVRMLGGLPERTPLNARVVGTLERDGYKIEKVIFESQPNLFVTANLYVPTRGSGPYPAVLFPLGHEDGAKANPVWQQILVTLARRGYVALAWDPIGQGERVQFYDPDFQDSKLGFSTTEHTELGIQCLPLGETVAKYTIWDGLRALDYLLSRKEVDAKRVACTGNSGGGLHTAYLSALDDRIQVAAPSCFITSWSRMLSGLGPQDGEQVLPNFLGEGLDYPDFIYAFGPKPYRMLSAIRDFFPIMGARETFAEVKDVYARIGIADRISMFEADDGHGYTAPRRAAGYEWLGRWLKNAPDREPEVEVRPETPEDLQCTATGQVATSLGGENVFTLNRKHAQALIAARSNTAPAADSVIRAARMRTDFAPRTGPVAVSTFGTIAQPGYRIEKLAYESEPGIVVPSLLYIPEGGAARKPALLMVDGAGKAGSRAAQEHFAQAGVIVLSIDARGLGETRPDIGTGDFARYFGDYDDGMSAVMLGKTLAGMRAEDIVRGLDLLSARPDVDAERLSGWGKDAGAVPLLYAAAFDKRLRRVSLEGMLVSYESLVNLRIHRRMFEQVVPGALREFDLPDVVAALAPRTVWLIDTVNPLGRKVHADEINRVYRRSAGLLRVHNTREGESLETVYDEAVR